MRNQRWFVFFASLLLAITVGISFGTAPVSAGQRSRRHQSPRFVGSMRADRAGDSSAKARPWTTDISLGFENSSTAQVEWRLDILPRGAYDRSQGRGLPIPESWYVGAWHWGHWYSARAFVLGQGTVNPDAVGEFDDVVANRARKVILLRVHDLATNSWPIIETFGVERRPRGAMIVHNIDLGAFFTGGSGGGGGGGGGGTTTFPDGIVVINRTGLDLNRDYSIRNSSYVFGSWQPYAFNAVVPNNSGGVNNPPAYGSLGLMDWELSLDFAGGANPDITVPANTGTMVDSNTRVIVISRNAAGQFVYAGWTP